MSDRPCNFCTLQSMKAIAKARGAKVTVIHGLCNSHKDVLVK